MKRFYVLICLTVAVMAASAVFAAVPQNINYQGYLKDSAGVPVTAPTSIRFSLYSSNPARNNPVWRETKSVTPNNGIYSTQLGSATPIAAPFDVPYYLGVKIEADAEMTLQPLSSVPYARRAAMADAVATGGVTTPTLADSSVTTAKIAAGAVTDSQISGTISAAKLDLSGVQKKYAKVAVVAQSGGDYSDPVTAMSDVAAWCGTPSATNPCLLKIMPGIYDLGSGTLAMQQFVDIEGSGELSTAITSAISVEPNATVRGASNSELRFLTVRNTAPNTLGVWGIGIANVGNSPRISHVTVTTSVASISCGIYNSSAAAPIISDVTTTAVGVNGSYGIVNKAAEPTLTNVTTSALGITSSNYAIMNNTSAPRLVNVIATASGGPINHGMFNVAASGSYTILIDRSTFEGSSTSISGTSAGYTLKIGASKLLGPIGSTGTYHYFASYSDTTTLDSATIGTQTFQTGADANKGLIVKGNSATQSANLQEWQDNAGAAVASVSPAGIFSGNGSGLTNLNAGNVTSGILPIVQGGTGASTAPTALTNLGAVAKAGDTMTGDLTISGASINLPVTTASGGMIRQGGAPLIHTYGTTSNFFAGVFAGNLTTTGSQNTACGGSALGSNSTGDQNTACGWAALYKNTAGLRNTASGTFALNENTTGNGNSALGTNAGITVSTGSNNTAIGYQADVTTGTLTNATAIGYNAKVGANNSLVLGGTGADAVNVGIGTTTPVARMTVVNSAAATRGVTVQGAASQTANLQEWQNSAGTALSSVTSAGVFTGNGSGLTGLNAANISSGVLPITRGGTGSSTQNFVDMSTAQASIGGNKTFTGTITAVELATTGNLTLPTTTATTGIIKSGTIPLMHTFGTVNFFAGRGAGNLSTTGTFLTASGANTLSSNTAGDYNTATGAFALNANTTGTRNTASGSDALHTNTTGSDNTATGAAVLYWNTTGYNNTANGTNALNSNTTASNNTAIGVSALAVQSYNNGGTAWSSHNTAVGWNALRVNQPTSTNNGAANTAMGANALANNTIGNLNTASGTGALYQNTTGSYNTASGNASLNANTTGTNNTALGSQAGYTKTSANANTTGNNNTFVGAFSGPGTATQLTNASAIGYNALVSQDNSLVLGGTGTDAVNVGIGTTTPHDRLDIFGTLRVNDNQIYLRTSGDTLHGVGWYVSDGFVSGSKDGPVVYGCGGGTLGSTCGGNRAALTWDNAGNVRVVGTLSKGGGSFKIDHPLDPKNKYLYHSFVESPDMMNIYNGNITTDDSGFATVELPAWFEVLNRDFRYQLTVIGQFAQAIIASEVENGRFTIRSDKPSVKVSWQVTGIRKDAFAEKNRIQVEEDKPAGEKGNCLHPEACN